MKADSVHLYERKQIGDVLPSNNRVVAIFSPILDTRQTVSYTLPSVSPATHSMKGDDEI